jgi:hypothetical protein
VSRSPISKQIRFDVFKRDGFTCVYCGAKSPDVLLECDHIHPVAEGGANEIDNLVTACQGCNRGKGAGLLSDVPKSISARAKEIKEREQQIAEFNEIMKGKRERIEAEAYNILDVMCEAYGRDSILKTHFASIKRFLELLPYEDVLEAHEIAHRRFKWTYNQHFKYFCGVCWRRIKRASGEETYEQ